jgi:hypothetical protein
VVSGAPHLPTDSPEEPDTIRDDLQTGDLAFCSGSYFFSHAIQRFTRSVWSHLGMI